jgi:hypothetical protein
MAERLEMLGAKSKMNNDLRVKVEGSTSDYILQHDLPAILLRPMIDGLNAKQRYQLRQWRNASTRNRLARQRMPCR